MHRGMMIRAGRNIWIRWRLSGVLRLTKNELIHAIRDTRQTRKFQMMCYKKATRTGRRLTINK